jgi:hypothetical protein
MEFKQIPDIVAYEEIADLNLSDPQARFFYEMNCPDRMARRLSTYIQLNGKTNSREKPSEWEYVPPEGNGAFCAKHFVQTRT